ncbi:DUF1801 domain-containing protein [Mucilaginibacter auburnensis]|uniref:Uncharacterized protein DUF1801 n=1 Tax=Mucilaginibacter auburnensis TaxID=1457233 RepID=A0A2H9VM60_9SPHI|nr:DUF1801 domain-containing protein [Mucilaginibacter auburnensis]PJJ79402.1 uncharacterized protein DUF1801 [Mucilaginibacter auburnensis]
MAKNKTTENATSVADFINSVADENKRNDSFKIVELIEHETGLPAKMWGPAIVGFGSYHYKYESGREGDAPLVGFSPRANAITFYIATGFAERDDLLNQLGKHTTGKGCVYVKKLNDIDTDVLKKLIRRSIEYMQEKYK